MNTPAFPHIEKDGTCHGGITLRQYYAAAALQGLFAQAAGARTEIRFEDLPARMVEAAFKTANAMLAYEESINTAATGSMRFVATPDLNQPTKPIV
jgi:hypothetical protein